MSTFGPSTRVHVVGVGGAGMSGVARLLVEMGCSVSGSDEHDSPVLGELRDAGVLVFVGHDASQVGDAQVVLWSPAIDLDNVELVRAREHGVTVMARAQLLAELARQQPVIGLTGTHGKTTATSMMVHVLAAAHRDDSRLLGAEVRGVGANGHWGHESLILEVDESYGSFALLSPSALGLLNVEADHLDHYGTLDALEAAFVGLIERTPGPVVAWGDDEGARRVADRASREVVLVGRADRGPWHVLDQHTERGRSSFTLRGPDADLELVLAVTGAHNVANAAVVAVLALELGVAASDVASGLGRFRGVPRRFELLGQWRGVDLYEDYAHLPGEISATLATLRALGYERVTAVFQPHRATRTLRLATSFATSFDDATNVVVTDIYLAGEANPTGATGELVADALIDLDPRRHVFYAPTFEEVAASLEELHDESDVVILLGAGDVAAVATQLRWGVSP